MAHSAQCVVSFIANLSPIYHGEEILGMHVARSLMDGTVIVPEPNDEQEPEDASVIVWCQGDSSRASEVPAYLMASNALVSYVQFHSVGRDAEYAGNLLDDLSKHFIHKTGATMCLPYREEEFAFLGKVLKATEAAGPKIAWEALKKGLGL
ncbi:hypothetical protein [Pseudomonas abietaniphila]|uniref:Uncharacterized protein n=1 Tax=Pseudomonas abietaniphila TaxID=89065 RepID=A0A1G8MNW0_9PSED|nr:hypothetical protein [Pseudomonas abietaniphila]SDI69010.1 hypothetical protein SAMN05216605_1161 [Pseudomonas abietaniphila]